jgi:hypothetical protein
MDMGMAASSVLQSPPVTPQSGNARGLFDVVEPWVGIALSLGIRVIVRGNMSRATYATISCIYLQPKFFQKD